MTVELRSYNHERDYEAVGDFLVRTHTPGLTLMNWPQPRWEYMHYHPSLNSKELYKIGIWEDDGSIVAVVNYEAGPGAAYFHLHPDYCHLKGEMLDYAEHNLYEVLEDGRRSIVAFINDFDTEFQQIAASKGYKMCQEYPESMSAYYITHPFPEITVPEGFKLKSLKDEDNLYKLHRVMWRGFNHPGEPPEEGIAWRIRMQSAPNLKKELNIVVEAPDGNFASYCGMWYDGVNRIAYVEPVATDPDYRRMGLGRAAVLEGVRRCGELGATVAYVGSVKDFYLSIGFKKLYMIHQWEKLFDI